MKKHVAIKVQGVVQGVFFRASTKEKADQLGIKGFVRNEPDGGVYIEAEGEEQALKQFIAWCEHGPPRAEVEQCDAQEGKLKEFSRFAVER
jgi:acylphosphatase